MTSKLPAYVLGGGANGLGVIRNLGRNNITVYGVIENQSQKLYSKFCKKWYVVPGIEKDSLVLKAFFLDRERENVGGVIFPTSDLFALHLSEVKMYLENSYRIPVSTSEIVRKLVDKKEFYQSLSKSKLNIPYPKTYFPETSDDVKKIAQDIDYPIFLKPLVTQIFVTNFRGKGFIANTPDELMNYFLVAKKNDLDMLLQEIIPGLAANNIYGVEGYFDKNSTVKAIFTHLRLRGWPPTFGNTCLRESISSEEVADIVSMTKQYLKTINYYGLMEAEWKRDPRDGSFKLLEINARQSMQNVLPSVCGINLILIAYIDAVKGNVKRMDTFKVGIKWVDFLNDFASMVDTHVSFRDWIGSLKDVQAWSYFAVDDVIPWVISSLNTINKIATGLLTR